MLGDNAWHRNSITSDTDVMKLWDDLEHDLTDYVVPSSPDTTPNLT